uniref:Uncharacterized protein n=1 Tax=Falco tinnunculus TaxID=100819 RepID=A0A8C4UY28_FALTI
VKMSSSCVAPYLCGRALDACWSPPFSHPAFTEKPSPCSFPYTYAGCGRELPHKDMLSRRYSADLRKTGSSACGPGVLQLQRKQLQACRAGLPSC